MKIRITIPSDPTCLNLIRNLVKESVLIERFDGVMVENIVQAVDEACSNVIEHSYRMDTSEELVMTMDADREKVTFLIEDTGVGLKAIRSKKPNIREYVEQRKDGGWGRYIIEHVMDEVKYSRRGKKNKLKLVKYFNGKGKKEDA